MAVTTFELATLVLHSLASIALFAAMVWRGETSLKDIEQ